MKRNIAPILWDLDAQGNTAPTVLPAATPQGITFSLSGLPGRIEDMFPYVQALHLRVSFSVTQGGGAAVLNGDKLWQAIESLRFYSPLLGELVNQRSGQGAAIGQIDQVIGAGFKFPTPMRAQIASAAANYPVELYVRIPLALDVLARPQDGGIWAPLLNNGMLTVNVNATTANLFQTGASIQAANATIRAALEVLPMKEAYVHAPFKAVRYEFQTSATQLRLQNFGNGDGLLGVNPGARCSFLAWLSNQNGLGGVDTVDKWTGFAYQQRNQRITNNPDFMMASFLAYLGKRVGPVGSIGSGVVNDRGGWPYTMAGGPDGSMLDASGLFFPIIWPGSNLALSSAQKFIGDQMIDARFSANPNGTHVFRSLEHYSFSPDAIRTIVANMGFDLSKFTVTPKTADNTDPGDIDPRQLWGIPLRVVPRGRARVEVI